MTRLKIFYQKYEESLLYLVFGGLTTLVDFLIYVLMTDGFHVNYLMSNVLAFIGAVVFAFVTNKIYVFKSHSFEPSRLLYEMTTFIGARLLSLVVNMVILYVFVEWVGIDDLIVKIAASVLVVIMNYAISKWLVFKKGSHEEDVL